MKTFLRITLIFLALALLVPGGVLSSFAEDALTGKVIETMDSGGYTYVQIENSGKKTWVAVPSTKVVKGQSISFAPGAEMQDFKSKTMNRTFDRIIFSGGVVEQTGKGSETKSIVSQKNAVTATEKVKVEKASGTNAYTVAEIYKNGNKLENKKVIVKGTVVKVSAGVMKKNWIHIQDGSGDAKTGSNDLVMTSNDLPSVGDVVTASGTLYNNKDFGGGYKYAVIIENTSIKH
ncbi:MAG: DNA-binding protein [Nitrospirae bacterium]|nr:DNA-binding protein [Nitrospirota bacterium]